MGDRGESETGGESGGGNGSETRVSLSPTARFTTSRLDRHWHAAARSVEVGRAPLGRVVFDTPLVLFRDRSGRAVALADRCPHRNVPLSAGRCVEGQVECGYHGWRFDGDGRCRAIPGLDDTSDPDRGVRRVPAFPVAEVDGMVWVVVGDGDPATPAPPKLVGVGERGYRTVGLTLEVPGPMLAAVENALDVPHTSFLHRGLFRGRSERVPVGVTVHHGPDFVEARFDGEPVPPGLIGKLLSPDGGVVEHVDRFVAPALAQVEYRLGSRHVALNACYTPVDDRSCRLVAIAAYRLPIPEPVARTALLPLAKVILGQDNTILRLQQQTIDRFGGERFVNTPIDLLGPHILRLVRRLERGEDAPADAAPDEHLTLLT